MSRLRKAAISAGFVYANYTFAIVTGIFLVPLTLRYLGARTWGLWLASGEVLNYAAAVEFGLLTVMPWMIAEADGRGDRATMRRFVTNGVWLGTLVGIAFVAASAMLWRVLPSTLFLIAADRSAMARPLAVLVIASALACPLGVFRSVLSGMQDVAFLGAMSVAQGALSVLITVVLLMGGYGVYALAWAAAGPQLVLMVASLIRVLWIAPDLRPDWSPPRIADLRPLMTSGLGVWLGNFGWQLLTASNAIVITYLGHPEWVPIYACTSKLGGMCMQIAWVLPDSGHIGLAQLQGERNVSRVREVVVLMLKLHLLTAGGAAIGLLIFNPAFVTRWVGPALFGGVRLNVVLALGVVFYSIIHGLITSAAVIGNRIHVGAVVLVNGVVQLALAVVLGHRFGIDGVAWAGLIAGAITSLPAAFVLLRPSTAIGVRVFVRDLFMPWLIRFAPVTAVAIAAGLFYRALGVVGAAVAAAVLCVAYAWQMRPIYASLPLDDRIVTWLVRFRLVPAAPIVPQPMPAIDEM